MEKTENDFKNLVKSSLEQFLYLKPEVKFSEDDIEFFCNLLTDNVKKIVNKYAIVKNEEYWSETMQNER
jgi:hypothetical protein